MLRRVRSALAGPLLVITAAPAAVEGAPLLAGVPRPRHPTRSSGRAAPASSGPTCGPCGGPGPPQAHAATKSRTRGLGVAASRRCTRAPGRPGHPCTLTGQVALNFPQPLCRPRGFAAAHTLGQHLRCPRGPASALPTCLFEPRPGLGPSLSLAGSRPRRPPALVPARCALTGQRSPGTSCCLVALRLSRAVHWR